MIGQYAGIGLLYAASAAAALVSLVIPENWLALLGLAPILIGLMQLLGTQAREITVPPVAGVLSVAASTLANGADNLGVYVPLFATSSAAENAVFGAVFAVMTALWCLAANWLVSHPAAGAPLRRYGPRAVPWALIGVGLWILAR